MSGQVLSWISRGKLLLAQETVIAGVCFVAILLLSSYVYADSMNRLSTISWKSIEVASSIGFDKLKSRLSITSVKVAADQRELYLNVTNDGTVKIDRADFAQIDVILTYTDETTNHTQTYWCYYNSTYYNSTDLSRHTWTLNPSFNNKNPYPSIVNPLDWDPSETLSLVVELSTSHQFRHDSVGYVKVVLPQGSSNGCSFLTGA
jgi:archaellum component FlaF (FlaF/FlaG flagellin family)